MQLRFWVYRRNLSSNPHSPFRSNGEMMWKAGCCISGFLGLIFLGLALMCLFSAQADRDGKLFFLFTALFGIFELICLIYSCIPWFHKYCNCSQNEEDDYSTNSLLSSDEDGNQEVPGNQGISSYQACVGYTEPPTYEAGPSYQEISGYQATPYGAEGGFVPGIANLRSLANYEGVFSKQQIPIYQEDLIEPQLPPYSSRHMHRIKYPQLDIHVY